MRKEEKILEFPLTLFGSKKEEEKYSNLYYLTFLPFALQFFLLIIFPSFSLSFSKFQTEPGKKWKGKKNNLEEN